MMFMIVLVQEYRIEYRPTLQVPIIDCFSACHMSQSLQFAVFRRESLSGFRSLVVRRLISSSATAARNTGSRFRSMSTNADSNVTASTSTSTPLLDNVVLQWFLSENRPGHATIRLQPQGPSPTRPATAITSTTEAPASTSNNTSINTSTITTTTTIATTIATDSHFSTDDTTIPDTVLQYQRQVRKAQHAKKAGAILTEDQLQTVHVDQDIVVVNKPSGVLTVPGLNGHSSLTDLVHSKYALGDATGTTPAHLIVHRLDMDTSGLLIFGRTAAVTAILHTAFRERLVQKEYQAVVMGHFPLDSATLDLPLQRDHAHPPFMRVSTPVSEAQMEAVLVDLKAHGYKKLTRKRPKPSQTLLRVLERGTTETSAGVVLPWTVVRLTPVTGRTHQLRVHCAAAGYPIVGDPSYSLYGEAAATGGITDVPVTVYSEQQQQEDDDDDDDDDDDATTIKEDDTLIHSRLLAGRPSIKLQKAWTAAHPPNVKSMCLHAAMLRLKHPVTGQDCQWEVAPEFSIGE